MQKIKSGLILLMLLGLSSCELAAGIFKMGMGVGVFLVIAVIVVIIVIISKMSGRK